MRDFLQKWKLTGPKQEFTAPERRMSARDPQKIQGDNIRKAKCRADPAPRFFLNPSNITIQTYMHTSSCITIQSQ